MPLLLLILFFIIFRLFIDDYFLMLFAMFRYGYYFLTLLSFAIIIIIFERCDCFIVFATFTPSRQRVVCCRCFSFQYCYFCHYFSLIFAAFAAISATDYVITFCHC